MNNYDTLDHELIGLYDEMDSYMDMLKNDSYGIDISTGEAPDGSTIASLLANDATRVKEILSFYEDATPEDMQESLLNEYYFLMDRINKLTDAINNEVDFVEEDGRTLDTNYCATEIAGDAMRVAEIERMLTAIADK